MFRYFLREAGWTLNVPAEPSICTFVVFWLCHSQIWSHFVAYCLKRERNCLTTLFSKLGGGKNSSRLFLPKGRGRGRNIFYENIFSRDISTKSSRMGMSWELLIWLTTHASFVLLQREFSIRRYLFILQQECVI